MCSTVNFGFVVVLMVCPGDSEIWQHMYYPENQKELIKSFQDAGELRDSRVSEVMRQVDRARYCPKSPYVDGPMPIGYGATISAPHMHVYALHQLRNHLVEGARALDVGSGSGYLTVCMALMVGDGGRVVGIDHIPELVNLSISNVLNDKPRLLRKGVLKFVEGDGRLGYPKDVPYNAIHVGAAAEEIPQLLIEQLAPGGRLVIPLGRQDVGQVMIVLDKRNDGEVVKTRHNAVRFVPLTDRKTQLEQYS